MDASLCSCLYNLCLFLASLQAPALVVVRNWSPFCSSCLIWGFAFSLWWQGDPDSQGCPSSAVLMLCFHSPCLAHLIPARQFYSLSLLISTPASSGLIQLALPSSMCAWVWGEYKWNNSWMKGQTGVFNNTDQQEGVERGGKAPRQRRL